MGIGHIVWYLVIGVRVLRLHVTQITFRGFPSKPIQKGRLIWCLHLIWHYSFKANKKLFSKNRNFSREFKTYLHFWASLLPVYYYKLSEMM